MRIVRSIRFMALLLGAALATTTSCSQEILPDTDGFADRLSDLQRARSANIDQGRFYEVSAKGLSQRPISARFVAERFGSDTPVVMIHGSNYDTTKPGLDNPHLTIYEVIRDRLASAPKFAPIGLGWSSVRFNIRNLLDAWSQGHATPYGLTQQRTVAVIGGLRVLLSEMDRPYNVICHSIGCDITRRALLETGNPPDRILMLSPDTDYQSMHDWALANGVQVLHATAQNDGLLTFSQFARRNEGFAPSNGQKTYIYRRVNVAELAPSWSRFDTTYGNPRRYWDHMATLELPQLWPCYIAFLKTGHVTECVGSGIVTDE